MDGPTTDRYDDFPDLTFDRPAAGVLRITLDGPGLNAVDHAVHRQLADVWLHGRPRPRRRTCALLQGAGKAFSAGGSFELIESIIDDYAARAARHARGARPRVQRHRLLEADRVGHARPRRRRRAGRRAPGRRLDRRPAPPASSTATPASASPPATTPPSAGRCCAAWPRRSTTCSPATTLTGEEAERIGLVSLCVDDDQVHAEALEVADAARRRRPVGHPLDQAHAERLVPQPDGRSSTPRSPTSSSGSAVRTPGRAWPATRRSARPGSGSHRRVARRSPAGHLEVAASVTGRR